MKASSRKPHLLPSPERLEQLSIALATLDAILSPEWEYRYYSFNKSWDAGKQLRMGSMRNGSGDEYYALFGPAGVAIKGWAHEYPMAQPGNPPKGVLDNFPASFSDFLTEPAFTMENATFCLWRLVGQEWSAGPVDYPAGEDPDGSEFLLDLLTRTAADYQSYARDYFETDVSTDDIAKVFWHAPLTDELVHSLNSETKLGDLAGDLSEIGYPITS